VWVYLYSLAGWFTGDKYVLAAGLSREMVSRIILAGYHVIPVTAVEHPMRDRWLLYHQFLGLGRHETCLATDSRTVLFQANPFEAVPPNCLAAFVGEGMVHAVSPWNIYDQLAFQLSAGVSARYDDWPVVNGGVIYGTSALVSETSLAIYLLMLTSGTDGTDQAVVNFLWQHVFRQRPGCVLALPTDSGLCLTGEPLRVGALRERAEVEWRAGAFRRPLLGPYAIVHQWDRTTHAAQIQQEAAAAHAQPVAHRHAPTSVLSAR